MGKIPEWILQLDDEDIMFVRRFILASGSLKAIAAEYGVTYPTVRLRLDRIIQKITLSEEAGSEPFTSYVKSLVLEDKIDYSVAKGLIDKYREQKEE